MVDLEALVDPAVCEAKFARELVQYREREAEYRRRGWWLLEATFPVVFIVFAAPQLTPPAVVFGATLDFTNYDLWPPSVRLVNPFTREPYTASELPTILKRRTIAPAPAALAALRPQGPQPTMVQETPLMQAYGPDEVPFLCLPGVREYHAHPGHSGDSWLLHRGRGEGTLHFLLEKLYQYGVVPLSGYNVHLVPTIAGFAQVEVPE